MLLVYVIFVAILLCVLRFLSKTSVLHIIAAFWQSLEDRLYLYQSYKVPQFNENLQENLLYRKVYTYLHSLPSVEDSDFTNLFTGSKPNDILLRLDPAQRISDSFLGARLWWTSEKSDSDAGRAFVLRLRKKEKRRVLRPYMQHILSVADDIDLRKGEINLYLNMENGSRENGRWKSVPFSHPATMDTVLMDGDLKNKVKSDLELFVKSKQYYHRLGRVWKRSYLLYGPSGTGKSSFIAAMARFLCFDIYNIDLSRVSDDSDLKMLLVQTTTKSLIVIENLDELLSAKSTAVSLSGILSFMDGIISYCGEERVMVFTINGKDQVDQTVIKPGRIDVHIHFPPCDFSAFKSLATSCLGVKEHKLFPQVEESFQNGAYLSQEEISDIMIANRNSPSRALKSVISALQSNKLGRRLSDYGSGQLVEESGDSGSLFSRESVHVKEFKKLYGFLRIGSRRKEEPLDLASADKQVQLN